MIETRRQESDRGKRCDYCGAQLYSRAPTWWIASHGEYCSKACGEKGASDLERTISKLEGRWIGRVRNDDQTLLRNT